MSIKSYTETETDLGQDKGTLTMYIAIDGLEYGFGLGFLFCTEIGSRDLGPSLYNVNIFCVV